MSNASQSNGKSSWQLALTAAGVIGAFVTTLLSVNSQFAEVRAEQAISKTERTEIRSTSEKLSATVSSLREELVAMKAALTEVETQFSAVENYINLMRADQLRTNGLLWKQSFGERYPEAAFFPSISRRKP